MNNLSFSKRDLASVWHPCTQMKDHEWLPLIPIKKGEGVWLEDYDGNRYIDAISSWWVNLFGHANPRINDAIKHQLDTLEHTIMGGFTHEPVINLSEKLIDITPQGLNHCFYADNGSSAVEVALKMSFHYWHNAGNTRKTKFINLANSYHGETLGALSVGDVSLYKETYKALLLDVITAPSPDAYLREPGESKRDYALRSFAGMEQILQQHADEACAVIIEPMVQCAGNMRMYDAIYLNKLREACTKYNVHLIADEIAVGFGRTGKMFGCNHANITPDFMCLSKGLTGGYLPLSAVITTENIYQAFYDNYENLTAFLHSHSYTGNPLACAAALATLSIFKTDNVLENNIQLIDSMKQATEHFIDHPHVADVRQTGMILAIELIKDKQKKQPYPWQERRGLTVYQHGLKNNAILRPLGNVIYFMPPYIITPEQIEYLANTAWQGIQLATAD
ncbi:MAG: adenosylmethionine--8-amino-7-oxononanoate transaminase [Gammaproteobacteria bacterium]|nr:adenosylmethionine--8-amino-7-oxononanoate transaminase [Gammaproteobacteria bacterium]MDH5735486.1 adenosylmethionine--8-amino-7-oxononanoate transaminase [Gammaproteobacteria bacterium]